MKQLYLLLTALILAAAVNTPAMSQENQKTSKSTANNSVRHVVLFKFKDTTSPEQVRVVEQAFAALPSKINTITGFEWGTNMSPENLAQGFTHCFLLSFKNAADRDAYLPHPAHKEFGKILGSSIDKVLVIDFVSQEK